MPFFDDALAAAKISPEAFAAEFEKPGADANAMRGLFDFLLVELINTIDDINLPPLLKILIEHDVNLEVEDIVHCRPLAIAYKQIKPLTFDFLIAQKVTLEQGLGKPVLCNFPDDIRENDLKTDNFLEMMKTLIEKHNVDINIQDTCGYSALHRAAKYNYPKIISYLLSKENIDLFLHTHGAHQTALGIAYEKYISASKSFPKDHTYTILTKTCLDLLIKAVYQHLYKKAIAFRGTENELKNELVKDLGIAAGDYNDRINEPKETPTAMQIDNTLTLR